MSEFFDLSIASPTETSEAVDVAVDIVRNEMLVVLPTDTVYGIGADAFSHEAVRQLLDAKGRGRDMPPPVLIPGVSTVDGVATEISDDARLLMSSFWPGALTLILWAQPSLQWDLGDTEGTVAVRVPSHHVALDVLRQTGPLAVTSANRTGRSTARTGQEAQEIFGPQVGAYLDLGELGEGTSSTIVDCTRTPHRIVRRGALSTETLREVVPDLVDETAPPDTPEQGETGDTSESGNGGATGSLAGGVADSDSSENDQGIAPAPTPAMQAPDPNERVTSERPTPANDLGTGSDVGRVPQATSPAGARQQNAAPRDSDQQRSEFAVVDPDADDAASFPIAE